LQPLLDAINALQGNDQVKRALLALVKAADGDLPRLRAAIEAWFNSTMDRVAGWYKRWSQWMIFSAGLVLVAILNADTLSLGHSLVADPSVRQSLVAAAQESLQRQSADARKSLNEQPTEELKKLQSMGLPIGWNTKDPRTWPEDRGAWVMKIIGLLLTAFAINLGAPFWFDVLSKFMVIRSTVKPTEKSPKEKSKEKSN
jgi:hypothetical protein